MRLLCAVLCVMLLASCAKQEEKRTEIVKVPEESIIMKNLHDEFRLEALQQAKKMQIYPLSRKELDVTLSAYSTAIAKDLNIHCEFLQEKEREKFYDNMYIPAAVMLILLEKNHDVPKVVIKAYAMTIAASGFRKAKQVDYFNCNDNAKTVVEETSKVISIMADMQEKKKKQSFGTEI